VMLPKLKYLELHRAHIFNKVILTQLRVQNQR
jgi:hypothetical protein